MQSGFILTDNIILTADPGVNRRGTSVAVTCLLPLTCSRRSSSEALVWTCCKAEATPPFLYLVDEITEQSSSAIKDRPKRECGPVLFVLE